MPAQPTKTHLSYRYRLYPTPEQAEALLAEMSRCRWVWNQAKAYKDQAWQTTQRIVNMPELSKHLTAARAELPWLRKGSAVAQQQALRELCAAYLRVWSWRRKGKKRGGQLPGFRTAKKGAWRTVRYTRNAYRVDACARMLLPAIPGPLAVRWSRSLPSLPSSVTIKLGASGRWHAIFNVELATHALPATGHNIGIDLGVTHVYALSNGHREPPPGHLQRKQRAVRRSQRAMSRKRRGSANREKARVHLARRHAKVADARRDFLHSHTTALIQQFDVLCVEDLAVANLLRSAKGTIDAPGYNVAAKSALNRKISDASWGTLAAMMKYKAALYGRDLCVVSRYYPSSKTCSECGAAKAKLALSERTFRCTACGLTIDRDTNAARNILAAGLAERQNACGGRGSPRSLRRARRHPAKQEALPVTADSPAI